MNDLLNDSGDPGIDASKNYLEELVGDGKKFKSVEDLARGKAEADLYISTLTRQQDEMRSDLEKLRQEYNTSASLRELLTEWKNTSPPSDTNTTPLVKDENVFDLTKVESLVNDTIERKTREQRERENFNSVQAKLKEEFGNNYSQILRQKRDELGLSDEEVNGLAKRSPKAFFNTFGISERKTEGFDAPPASQRRLDNFSPMSNEKRTWSYYQKMKRDNPNLYRDPKTVVQMHKDAVALGSAFQDGDYHKFG